MPGKATKSSPKNNDADQKSSIKVLNIKVAALDLQKEVSNKLNKPMQECVNILKKANITNPSKLLPLRPKHTVTFELKNTVADFANAIRRCITDELRVLSLHVALSDVDTSDPFILSDVIKDQIELLPVNQLLRHEKNTKISLYKENATDHDVEVCSHDITMRDGPKDAFLVNPNIVLCILRAGEYIKINNIKLVEGRTKDQAGKFSAIGGILYDILDADPLRETADGLEGVSSMVSNHGHFMIGYSTHRNHDKPTQFVVSACDALIERIAIIMDNAKKIPKNAESHYSDKLTLESDGCMQVLHINGEYFTLANLLARYIYIITEENINFITPSVYDLSDEVGSIRCSHPEFVDLLIEACARSIADLQSVKKHFV
jgi:DNA-directed RNA polymerase subunit L